MLHKWCLPWEGEMSLGPGKELLVAKAYTNKYRLLALVYTALPD